MRLPRLKPAAALRRALREGYGRDRLRADIFSGLVVGVVALPLSMALAIAVGMPPQHGLYTAIVAGALIALLGGSSVQVSGPTAAFVVVLAPIVERFGPAGLLVATAMAGALLIAFAFARFGRLIELMPSPVTTGFTAGIGIVIATLQLKDFLGLTVSAWPEAYLGKVAALVRALPSARPTEFGVGLLTLILLILWPRWNQSIPAPLVALAAAALAATLLERWGLPVEELRDRFSYVTADGRTLPGIPRLPPHPLLPWRLPGPNGEPFTLSFDVVRALLPAAFTIAVLGAIESLLSAVVADGMIRRRHDPDAELLAQGLGNLVAPFFGGIAATGAIARTATNVRHGGRSPVAALVHSLFLLVAVLLLAPLLGFLPMAALAALLLVVAWNMSEIRHVAHALRTAPRSDALVLLVCLGLTVVFDMVVAVTVGVLLASMLFMRRMIEVSRVRLVGVRRAGDPTPVEGLVIYEIAGPLFFGAAARAMRALHSVDPGVRAVVLDLRSVPVLDATGLVNLEAAVERLRQAGIFVVLAGLDRDPLRTLLRAGWRRRGEGLAMRRDFAAAVELATRSIEDDPCYATPP